MCCFHCFCCPQQVLTPRSVSILLVRDAFLCQFHRFLHFLYDHLTGSTVVWQSNLRFGALPCFEGCHLSRRGCFQLPRPPEAVHFDQTKNSMPKCHRQCLCLKTLGIGFGRLHLMNSFLIIISRPAYLYFKYF